MCGGFPSEKGVKLSKEVHLPALWIRDGVPSNTRIHNRFLSGRMAGRPLHRTHGPLSGHGPDPLMNTLAAPEADDSRMRRPGFRSLCDRYQRACAAEGVDGA